MIIPMEEALLSLIRAASQIITGKLLSDEQIKQISENVVGAYFIDWLPETKHEKETKERVEEARSHIFQASQIISTLQDDLDNQTNKLDQIIIEIEEKKKLADHYSTLAETKEKAFEAFKIEIEKAVRVQLKAEAERGKKARQVVSFVFWLITLILGAALGAYFIPLVDLIRTWLTP